jgi:small-conductance mechanosensitive channel
MSLFFGWLKGPWFWLAVIGALVVLLLGQQVQVSNAKARVARAEKAVSDEQLDRANANTARALTVLTELQRLIGLIADHAQTQQELSNELASKNLALAAATARGDALDQRMRNTAAALGAALDRADAEARKHASERQSDQPETVYGVLADGVRLVGEGGTVVRACVRDLARRDAEVAALKGLLDADNTLLDGIALGTSLAPEAKLPSWTQTTRP